MIYLQLFFTFLKVGAFAFGGGYAMLSLIQDSVISYGWMSEEEFLNFVGVETVIPGPVAVNTATYIGYTEGGFAGALLATLGVTLPSFLIILFIASILKNLLKYPSVQAILAGMRPAIAGLILSVAVTMGITAFWEKSSNAAFPVDFRKLIVLGVVAAVSLLWKKYKKRECSSILLVAVSGVVGMALFGI